MWLITGVLLSVLGTSFSQAACGKRPSGSRIVGGSNAQPNSWPWQLSLRVFNSHNCGASLISREWAVTAAHCVDRSSDPNRYTLLAGAHHRTSGGQVLRISQVIKHEGFSMQHLKNDIAVLKLASPVTLTPKIQTICLPSQGSRVAAGHQCYITGWGRISSQNNVLGTYLQQAKVPIASHQQCLSKNGNIVHEPSMVCAGGVGSSACNGDSGGPLACEENGSWILRGAASWVTSRTCPGHTYSVYARVSEQINWISSKTGGNLGTPAPATPAPGCGGGLTTPAPLITNQPTAGPQGECNSPRLLSESDRVKTFNDRKVVKCDNGLSEGSWYRFSGGAGAQIPEAVVPTWHCGTHAPGWMDGKHPSVGEGVVSRKVCFHWTSGNCQWSKVIQVRNCGNFYVYKLLKPPGCSMRYCGEQVGNGGTPSPPNTPPPPNTPAPPTQAPSAPECNYPKLLSESDRVKTFNDRKVVKCDNGLSEGSWYRFAGGAGVQIPETVVPTWHCGTHAPGWMDGKHPSVGEGMVSRKVCFHWTSGNCQWSKVIQVRNCGNFYVYKLLKPPGCSMRYCGEHVGGVATMPPTQPPLPTTVPSGTRPPQPQGGCGVSPVSRVIGGVDATPGQWPWQIALLNNGRFSCGGSLITPDWVVTAAHCVARSPNAANYKVRVGEHNRNVNEGSEEDIPAKRVIVHPSYGNPVLNNDIALIQLSRSANLQHARVATVCLPAHGEQVSTSSRCFITGWGKIKHPGSSHHILQQANLPPVTNDVCAKKLAASPGGSSLKITPNMICAGKAGTILSGCHGDSGGPYVCQSSAGRWVLQGAVSWGSPRCSAAERYTVFARVAMFRQWIDQYTGGSGGTPPPPNSPQPPTQPPSGGHKECSSYKTLSDAERNIGHVNQKVTCDRDFAGEWYRFTGQAGSQMPESPVPKHKCGTHAPGWLSGKHPSVNEGEVSRKVCFHWSSSNCHWSTMIQVRNCGAFYVYKFGKPPTCSLRYCGESKGNPAPPNTPAPPTPPPSAPECNSPTLLTESNRVKTFNDRKVVLCDKSFSGNTWYRFAGGAGTQIPEAVVPEWHCGTHAPGWMDGKHPPVWSGVVSRKVCFHWVSVDCKWSTNIQVRNCGNFYVYKLVNPPGCNMRYCGEQVGNGGTPSPPNTPPPPTPAPPPSECSSYKTLSDAERNTGHVNQKVTCDRDFAGEWYRFTGQAGSQMPESPVPKNKCGTHAPGWLSGKHPSVNEGEVSRKVCFHWSSSNCHWSTMIQVRNCGAFYVYKFGKPPACSLRYCGEGNGGTPPPPNTAPPGTPPPPGSCGIRPSSRIVGGVAAKHGDWPWQAMLRTTSGFPYCGGTLVSPQWVVTATHCVTGKSPSSIIIRMGAHKRTSNVGSEQDIKVTKVITHPSYHRPQRYSHDIALLKLERPAALNRYVNLACLPNSVAAPSDGTKCWITGWGRLSSGGATPDLLQQVSVPVVSRARCDRAYPGKIHDSMICAGQDQGGIDSCQGDSGGPMVCESGGRYYLQGATSWGYGCAAPGKFGVYAKVKFLMRWLNSEMAKN